MEADKFSIFDAPTFRKQLLNLFCSEIDEEDLKKKDKDQYKVNVYCNDQKGSAVKSIHNRIKELSGQSDYAYRKTVVNGVTVYVPYPKNKDEKMENYLYMGGKSIEPLLAEKAKRGKRAIA